MSPANTARLPLTVLEAEAVPARGSARVAVASNLPKALRGFGVDIGDMLAASGMRADLFDDPENRILYRELERLMLECERRTNCDYLGLLAAQQTRLHDLGLAGQMALCAATAGQGMQDFADHFSLHSSVATFSVITSGAYTRLVYAIAEHGLADTRQLQLGAITYAFNILQDLCGVGWLPMVVTFAIRAPSNLKPLQKFFRAPLRFDSGESALVFERHWLDRPLRPVDAGFRRQVEASARAQRASLLTDFPTTMRRVLRKQLLIGDCSMDGIAALVGVHRRTLDRHLQKHGVQYRELLESVKDDVARQLLRDTRLPIQQIAEVLHFSSPANFATAFRRWTGVTPSEFRRSAR